MKTEKIIINKTAERPEGVEIEIILPEGRLEERLLSFLMTSFVRELKRDNRVPYDLPQRFTVEYKGQGTFLASGFPESSGYYEPARPVAILGLRVAEGRFDLVHAPVPTFATQPVQSQESTRPVEPPVTSPPGPVSMAGQDEPPTPSHEPSGGEAGEAAAQAPPMASSDISPPASESEEELPPKRDEEHS